jgi:hypothetical protein
MSDPIPFSFRCEAKWDDMLGSGGRRLCTQCDKVVVDLSSLPKAKADEVLATPGVCVNYRVVDGAVMYASEPVVAAAVGQANRAGARRRAAGRRLVRWTGAAAAALASSTAFAGAAPIEDGGWERVKTWVGSWFAEEQRLGGAPTPIDPEPVRLGGGPVPQEPVGSVDTVVHVASTVAAVALEIRCDDGLRDRASFINHVASFQQGEPGMSCVATFKGLAFPAQANLALGQTYDCTVEDTQVDCTAR